MDSQSSQSAESATSRLTGEQSTPVAPLTQRFSWLGRDISDAGLIAFMLGVLHPRHVPHGEAVIESMIELQLRPPRLTDAWRFFHAAATLKQTRQTLLAATAHRIGARIALAVTGWLVTDMCLAECGTSSGLGLYVDGAASPVVLAFKDHDGRTVLDDPMLATAPAKSPDAEIGVLS